MWDVQAARARKTAAIAHLLGLGVWKGLIAFQTGRATVRVPGTGSSRG
jgi:hypothetical protein